MSADNVPVMPDAIALVAGTTETSFSITIPLVADDVEPEFKAKYKPEYKSKYKPDYQAASSLFFD
jgi:hypothetical protein